MQKLTRLKKYIQILIICGGFSTIFIGGFLVFGFGLGDFPIDTSYKNKEIFLPSAGVMFWFGWAYLILGIIVLVWKRGNKFSSKLTLALSISHIIFFLAILVLFLYFGTPSTICFSLPIGMDLLLIWFNLQYRNLQKGFHKQI